MRRGARTAGRATGFTLVELLVVLAIIGLLASTVLFAMVGAQENARAERTRSQIKRIDAMISQKWGEFETMRVSMATISPGVGQVRKMAKLRVDATRAMMRLLLPDRKSDLAPELQDNEIERTLDHPTERDPRTGQRLKVLPAIPTQFRTYRRMADRLVSAARPGTSWRDENGWTRQYQGAECLYLILSQIVDDDRSAMEFFSQEEIGDVDRDGMPEILDAWGSPISFLRWAPGFRFDDDTVPVALRTKTPVAGSKQSRGIADPFDPLGVYSSYGTFALFPLIYSSGPDKSPDLVSEPFSDTNPLRYSQYNNDPFVAIPGSVDSVAGVPVGTVFDTNDDKVDNSADNIHNHTATAVGG
jgi:prepilin-type N-terminal cleavage/methylation domain-containing protein